MFPFKRTKILATVGPAVNSYEKIEALVESGVNGFRINFSHAQYDACEQIIAWIREASHKHQRHVAILQDLQGPKIRFGDLDVERLEVSAGDTYRLVYGAEHEGDVLPVQYNLAEKVKTGETVYLFDGKIRTIVTDIIDDTTIEIRVENDGFLMSRKAINLPDTDFGGDILTPKDLADIEFGASQDIDFVALSFVQSEQDINDLRQLLVGYGSNAHVIAKIETKAAIQPRTLEQIVQVSDGIMVARGDLAVEVGAHIVPVAQKKIIELCRIHGKLSIVATQMMASMVDAPSPTRAEVSDVATAVMEGADTVMLSDETAMGRFPIETVQAMRSVILYTQDHTISRASRPESDSDTTSRRNAIAYAAVSIADELDADIIIAETKEGGTAANIAACRPHQPIISVTSLTHVAQQLALSYANRSFVRNDGDDAGLALARELHGEGFFGELTRLNVVTVHGLQPGLSGGTDTIRACVIE